MLVTVRLFAQLRELAGWSEAARELPEGSTVRTAWEALASELPALGPHGRSVSAAINDDYARFTSELRAGDVVAFLPPVSGGSASRTRSSRGDQGHHVEKADEEGSGLNGPRRTYV